ncbi:MAG: hypothetical protein V2I51_20040, partial [Anderseniella sp.]|nr:hypothetical protein [Anderseniella sp.]
MKIPTHVLKGIKEYAEAWSYSEENRKELIKEEKDAYNKFSSIEFQGISELEKEELVKMVMEST